MLPPIPTDEEFKLLVISQLARLATQMEALLGNGQQGRVATLEEKVDAHERTLERRQGASKVWLAIIGVGGSVVGGLVQWLLATHPR